MHGIAASPTIDNLGLVTVAEGQDRLISRPCEVAEPHWPAWRVRWGVLEQGADVLQTDHTFARVVKELGIMFDTEDVVFELEAVLLDGGRVDVGTHGGSDSESPPEVCLSGHDLVETAGGLAGRAHEQTEAGGTALEGL